MKEITQRRDALLKEKEALLKEKQVAELAREKLEKESVVVATEVAEVKELETEIENLKGEIRAAKQVGMEKQKEIDDLTRPILAQPVSESKIDWVEDADVTPTQENEDAEVAWVDTEEKEEVETAAGSEAPKKQMTLDEMAAKLKAERPDDLSISVNNQGVNSIRADNNKQSHIENVPEAHFPILAENEIEIRIETPEEQQKYFPIAGSDGVCSPGGSLITYEDAVESMQAYIDTGKLEGKEIIVYDSIGFMKRFEGELNIIKTYTAHEYYRTVEGVQELEDKLIESYQISNYQMGFWKIHVPLEGLVLGNQTFLERYHAATDSATTDPNKESKSDVLTELRESIQVEYNTGSFPPESEGKPVRHTQLAGSHNQPIDKWEYEISIVADLGQHARVFRADGFSPNTRVGDYYIYNDDDTHGPGDAEGGKVTLN